MKLKNLTLFDWRSYERAEAAFAPGVNLLVGENAQGKTNLLEAIVYLSQGQSFRTRSQAELVRLGAEFADLQAELFDEERTQSLRAVIFASRRPRQLYVGGVKKKSGADLAGLLPTVPRPGAGSSTIPCASSGRPTRSRCWNTAAAWSARGGS